MQNEYRDQKWVIVLVDDVDVNVYNFLKFESNDK